MITASDTNTKGEVHHISKEDEDNKTFKYFFIVKQNCCSGKRENNDLPKQLWRVIKH